MRRWSRVTAVAGMLVIALFAPGRFLQQPARAAATWDVIVGGDDIDNAITTYAYWPSAITIHTGDTVRWSFFSRIEQHTVSFMRTDPPLALYTPGPGPGEYTLGPAWYPLG